METSQGTIPIGELSRRTACNIETIRYYERIGLLPKPVRRNRYRCYIADDVRRLVFVRRARELGFPIESIRTLLTIAGGGAENCREAREVAQSHLKEVRAKLDDLMRMQGVLNDVIRACDTNHTISCPLLDTLADIDAFQTE